MTSLLTRLATADPLARHLAFGILGVLVGNLLCRWIILLTEPIDGRPLDRSCSAWWHRLPVLGGLLAGGRGRYRGQPTGHWWPMLELATGLLFAGFAFAYLHWKCQQTPDVVPIEFWRVGRLFYHLILISLLIAATGTDFRDYTISDWITLPGILIGVLAATASGDLQMMHVWVDWHYELPGVEGPYRPAWMALHPHLHGLAWSLCGMLTGAALSAVVRGVSKLLLGQEAMGFGDITLMAMIGSFIGWQPVLFVFLLAPLCGLLVSIAVRLITDRTFLPYGPYLSAATLVVLFTWRWIWMLELPISDDRKFSVRLLMADWVILLIAGGIALGGFVLLLGMLRLYRSIPVASRSKPGSDAGGSSVGDATKAFHDDDTRHE